MPCSLWKSAVPPAWADSVAAAHSGRLARQGTGGHDLLLLAQLIFLPATVVFLGQEIQGDWRVALGALLLVDAGMCALGSLLGALAQGEAARESCSASFFFLCWCPCCWRASA